MRKTVFRALVFVLMIIVMIILNMYVFRSSLPIFWFLTLIGSVLILIIFPYNKFFKQTNSN